MTDKREKLQNLLFYTALTIELVLMVVEKSELTFSLESYVFRATFLLTLLAVAVMRHDRREWFVIAALLLFTFACYRLSGKNDLMRLAVLLMASRDVDPRQAVKYSFFISAAGFAVIVLLSVFGVMGDVAIIGDFGRGIANERRLVLGFGHPNTLFGCVYVLVIMWLWLYGTSASALIYGLVVVLSLLLAVLTKSRTGILILIMTFAVALALRFIPKLKECRGFYYLVGLVTPVLCVLSAVLCAGLAEWAYFGGEVTDNATYWKLDNMLNNRISNLYYGVPEHGGILSNWKLFALRGSDGYFDMGWNRLFYWYGIIPTVLIALAVLWLVYVCMVKKDGFTALVILSVSVYTIIEATFVTRYLGRDFFLIIAGAYLGSCFRDDILKLRDKEGPVNV